MWEIYALDNAVFYIAVYGLDKLLHTTRNVQTQMKSTVSGHSEYSFNSEIMQHKMQTIAAKHEIRGRSKNV